MVFQTNKCEGPYSKCSMFETHGSQCGWNVVGEGKSRTAWKASQGPDYRLLSGGARNSKSEGKPRTR